MERILCVDRSALVQQLVRESALSVHASVTSSGSLAEARAKLGETGHHDLILVTNQLPDGTGLDLIDWIRESEHRDTPVVLVSADDSTELKERAFAHGAADCIPKRSLHGSTIGHLLSSARVSVSTDLWMTGASIAVVDDSASARAFLRRQLGTIGVDVSAEFSSGEALASHGATFDVYLVDIVLAGTSGVSVIRTLRDAVPDAVILAVSSLDSSEAVAAALGAGADDYVVKPADGAQLIMRVRRAAEMRQLYRALRSANAALQRAATTDRLTGIANRALMTERLASALERRLAGEGDGMASPVGPVLFLLLDIDHFKRVNDTWGHPAGDEVLRVVARRIEVAVDQWASAANAQVLVGRFGGEEFAVLAQVRGENDVAAELIHLAERIRTAIASTPFALPDASEAIVSVSVGGAHADEPLAPGTADAMTDIIGRADRRLYRAKRQGRNRSVVDDTDAVPGGSGDIDSQGCEEIRGEQEWSRLAP